MTPQPSTNEPFCSNCGYVLTGLTESSKCPECGRPLVDVLTRRAFSPAFRSKRYQSKAKILGWPVVSVALGPSGNELRGHAKGLIAVGDIATGGIAVGGVAMGGVTIGGVSIGLCSFGGVSAGILTALGGCAVSLGLAFGGLAVGSIATGGLAVGLVAQGGLAVGLIARGGLSIRLGGASIGGFQRLNWLLGPWPPARGNNLNAQLGAMRPMLLPFMLGILLSTVIGLLALIKTRSRNQG
jgi:hypothetical protein